MRLVAVLASIVGAYACYLFVYAKVKKDLLEHFSREKHRTTVHEEKWENFLKMAKVPTAVRLWYTYSETESEALGHLEGDHPDVIKFVRDYRLVPIPKTRDRTKLPQRDTSKGRSTLLMDIFRNKTKGYFVECGALDGVKFSNTLLMERQFEWSGLLVEADPIMFEQLLEKKRTAHLVPACLSIHPRPKMWRFTFGARMAGRLTAPDSKLNTVNVQCLPLHSLLLAVNRTTVDLLSLDVEGNELDVLMTIPFDTIDIKVLLVEFYYTYQGKKALEDFMIDKGYVIYPSTPEEREVNGWAFEDHIFVKKGSGYKETRDGVV